MVREKSAPTRSSSRQTKPTEKAADLLLEKRLRSKSPGRTSLDSNKSPENKSNDRVQSPISSKGKSSPKTRTPPGKTATHCLASGKLVTLDLQSSGGSPKPMDTKLAIDSESNEDIRNGSTSESPSKRKVGRPRKVASVAKIVDESVQQNVSTPPSSLTQSDHHRTLTGTSTSNQNNLNVLPRPPILKIPEPYLNRRKQIFPISTNTQQDHYSSNASSSPSISNQSYSPTLHAKMTNAELATQAMPPPPVPRAPTQHKVTFAEDKVLPKHLRIESKESVQETNFRPMAQILMETGYSLVCQQVFRDLSKAQRHQKGNEKHDEHAIAEHHRKALEEVVSFQYPSLSCNLCGFKTESMNILELHKEYAHFERGLYHCPFCDYTTKVIQSFFQHTIDIHNRRGRIHMKKPQNACPFCQFECTFKSKYQKHVEKCCMSYIGSHNLEPSPADCDIPLKKFKKKKKKMSIDEINYPVPTSTPTIVPTSNEDDIIPQVAANVAANLGQNSQTWANQSPNGIDSNMSTGRSSGPLFYYNTPSGPVFTFMSPSGVPTGMTGGVPVGMGSPMGSPMSSASPGGNGVSMVNSPYSYMPIQGNSPGASVFPTNWASPAANTELPAADSPQPTENTRSSDVTTKSSDLPTTPTEPALHVCEVCNALMKDQESLRIHLRWAHHTNIHRSVFEQEDGCIPCKHCEKRFWSTQGLARHKASCHESAWYTEAMSPPIFTKCLICEDLMDDILHHLEKEHSVTISTMQKSGHCMLCGKIPGTGDSMVNHLAEKHLVSIQRHTTALATRIVTPNRALWSLPYCSSCKEQFCSMEQYSAHCNTAHTIECPICPMKFCNMSGLADHCERMHSSKESARACVKCALVFNDDEAYIEHMAASHSGQISEHSRGHGPYSEDSNNGAVDLSTKSSMWKKQGENIEPKDKIEMNNMCSKFESKKKEGSRHDSFISTSECEEGEETEINFTIDSNEESETPTKRRKFRSRSGSEIAAVPSKGILDLDGKKILLASDDEDEENKRDESSPNKLLNSGVKRKAQAKELSMLETENDEKTPVSDEEDNTKSKRRRRKSATHWKGKYA